MSDSDFASMMAGSGVRRIGTPAPKHNPQRRPPPPPPRAALWSTGRDGLALVTEALRRTDRDLGLSALSGRPKGQIVVLVQQRGRLVDAGDPYELVRDAAGLLDHADRLGAELVVVTHEGWKLVMHPGSGAVSFARDPE